MIALWYTEAGKYNVLPLDSRGTMRFADERPQIAAERDDYVYFPGTQAVPENVAAKVLNRAHTITVDVEVVTGERACSPATAAMSAATSCSSRTASCTTCTTTSAPRNSASAPIEPITAGRHSVAL